MGLIILLVVLVIVLAVISLIVGYVDEPVGGVAVAIIGAIIIALIGISNYISSYANEQVITCHVTSKDRGGEDGSYRIYTDDCGTLANQDRILRGKTKSADVWATIPDKGVVTFRVVGYRNGVLSWFPNVLEVVSLEGR